VGHLEDTIKTDLKVECHIVDSIQRAWVSDQREGFLSDVMYPYALQNTEEYLHQFSDCTEWLYSTEIIRSDVISARQY